MKRKRKVEVEGGEALNFMGQGAMVEGPGHEGGGVDMELPEGTMVFSDRLKGLDGKTFAQREKRRLKQEAKAQKDLERSPTDLVARFTLDRIMSRNKIAREAEMQIQNLMQESETSMKYGGTVKKYPWGGVVGSMRNLNQFLKPSDENVPRVYNMFNTGYQNVPTTDPLEIRQPQRVMTDLSDILGNDDYMMPSSTSKPPQISTDITQGGMDIPQAMLSNAPSRLPDLPPDPSTTATTVADKVAQGVGPLLGPVGLGISAVAPLVTTLINRMGDKKPVNQFEDFGRAALESNAASMRGAAGVRDMTKRDIDLEAQGARNQARQSARGISTVRALDQATTAQSVAGKAAANTQFYQNLSNLFAQRGQLETTRDQAVMQGRKMAFDEQEQQRDNFFTNLSKDLNRVGMGAMWGAKMRKTPNFMKYWQNG